MSYQFSTKSIVDTTTFCFFHKGFVDYCKEHFQGGTFHLFFREEKNAVAFFITDDEETVITESEYFRNKVGYEYETER